MGKFRPKKGDVIGHDTETTGLNPWGTFKRFGFYPARPYAFSFYDTNDNSFYVRWEVDPMTRQVIPEKKSLNQLQDILENPGIRKVGHNLGYDIRMDNLSGVDIAGPYDDSLIMMHVATGGSEFEYGLKHLGAKYLDISSQDEKDLRESAIKARNVAKKKGWCIATEEVHGKDPIKADYWLADKELCKRYAILDAKRTLMLYHLVKDDVEEDEDLSTVYEREMRMFHLVAKMENRGVQVFPPEIDRLRIFYKKYMAEHLKKAEKNGGKGLNFGSPKQMVLKFFGERKYKPLDFGKPLKPKSKPYLAQYPDANPKCNGDFLVHADEKLGDKLARHVLEYKGGKHMITAFLDPYDRYRVKESKDIWVLHPNYKQCGPVTGRFSDSDPDLMQVASETTGRRRTEITLKPRECFGPRPGHVWYLPDYSQVEVWVFAFMSQEKTMMDALLAGRDFHGAVAEKVWGKHPKYLENKSYYRKRAKLLMFCKLYGGGVKKVAYLTDSTVAEATIFVAEFETELPGVQRFMTAMINRVRKHGKIVNAFGRNYFLSPNKAYKAVNYLIQGTCADLMKEAMLEVDDLFVNKWSGCHLLLTLHDELVCEVPLEYHSKELMKDIFTAMQKPGNVLKLPIPLPVSMKIASKRWNQTKSIEFYRKDLKKWI